MSLLRMMMADVETGWSPAAIAGSPPRIWLDDKAQFTMVGAAVSNWIDRSGSGYQFIQGSSGQRPTRLASELAGRDVVRFDGTDDRLTNSTGAGAVMRNVMAGWCFAVVRKRNVDASAAHRILFRTDTGVSGGTERFTMRLGSTNVAGRANVPELGIRRLDTDTFASLAGPSAIGTAWHLVLMSQDYAGRVGRIAIDGTQVAINNTLTTAGATSDTSSLAAVAIGGHPTVGSNYGDFDVAALLVGAGSAIPAAADFQRLEGWAAWRWGLVALLPAGHPYKGAPP